MPSVWGSLGVLLMAGDVVDGVSGRFWISGGWGVRSFLALQHRGGSDAEQTVVCSAKGETGNS